MLKTRVITALVLGAALLSIVLLLPPIATVIALVAIVLAGAWEWSAFLRVRPAVRWLYIAVVAALLPLAWQVTESMHGLVVLLSVAVVWWVIALLWILFAPKRVSSMTAAVAGLLALVPAWVALMRLRLDMPRGAEWMLFLLILVVVADIGAFFAGRKFGRLRLAPAVSPGKTWEGVFGGALFSGVVAIIGSVWFDVPLVVFIPLCLATVAFSIVGDLTESLLKRFAGVKDSGTLFPGHGGVMDRIDSVTGAAPVLFLGLVALGVLS